MKIFFIDFEDSFSNNIISYLKDWDDCDVVVKNYRHLSVDDFRNAQLILGPGPGHPDEYIDYFSHNGFNLNEAISKAKKVIGICLGHQLIFKTLYGCSIIRSSYPLHGRSIKFKDGQNFSDILECDNDISLQRYNSLIVDVENSHSDFKQTQLFFDDNDELLMAYDDEHIFTMQFHPESVGTSCSKSIFQAMERFFR